jgi:hypothetical protein
MGARLQLPGSVEFANFLCDIVHSHKLGTLSVEKIEGDGAPRDGSEAYNIVAGGTHIGKYRVWKQNGSSDFARRFEGKIPGYEKYGRRGHVMLEWSDRNFLGKKNGGYKRRDGYQHVFNFP